MTTQRTEYPAYPEYAKRCPKCGCEKIKGRVTAREGHVIYEQEFSCSVCNEVVAYWAYGYYDPGYDPENIPKEIKTE